MRELLALRALLNLHVFPATWQFVRRERKGLAKSPRQRLSAILRRFLFEEHKDGADHDLRHEKDERQPE